MFGRRRQRLEAMRQVENDAVRQVFEMTKIMTIPGGPITPDGVARAAHMVGMEVVQGAMEQGASPKDCAELMAAYGRVGAKLGSLFEPGAPYDGSTVDQFPEAGRF